MSKEVGGIKGFLQRAGASFNQAGGVAKDWSWWLAGHGARWGLFLASTSMVVLMPLIFEINREIMVRNLLAQSEQSWHRSFVHLTGLSLLS